MDLTREALAKLEIETGFRAATLEKVQRLGPLAREVAAHSFLGPRLLLKGGTAIQLGLGEPQRLSVDLDYNYVGQLDRAEMLRERPELEEGIHRIANAGGYRLSLSADDHAGRKFFLGYRSHTGAPDRIELDLNFQYRQPIREPVMRALWQPVPIEPLLVRSVSDEELWAGKICALLDRTMARDLFDVAQMRERSTVLTGAPHFRKIVIALCGVLDLPLHRYGRERLARLDDASIEQQLLPMLAGGDHPTRDILETRAWEILAPILELSAAERQYCDRLQRGELEPERVFPEDPEIVERFKRHPALQWKAANARAHHERQREVDPGDAR